VSAIPNPQLIIPPSKSIAGGEKRRPRGQVLVIFGFSLLALLAFVGLVTDAASLYVTYGQLKRAVDSAAVAGANEFKRGSTLANMNRAALEVLALHNVPMNEVDLKLYICDAGDKNGDGVYSGGADADGNRDAYLQTLVPSFYQKCPDTATGEAPRKLVWVEAKQRARVYFLSLFGVQSVLLTTNAVAEAALVNLVIVLDVSESMASEKNADGTWKTVGYNTTDYNPNAPGGCNLGTGECHPLKEAKAAAATLIGTLYQGYDAVGVVTFAHEARAVTGGLAKDLQGVIDMLQSPYPNGVLLNDDPPANKIWPQWRAAGRWYNPINPEDRDDDGLDADNDVLLYGVDCPAMSDPRMADRWWDHATEGGPDPYGWGGVPCDDDNALDAFDWNGNGVFDTGMMTGPDGTQVLGEDGYTKALLQQPNKWDGNLATLPNYLTLLSANSTCTGCGMRVASNLLRSYGSDSAVWVIIFLSDGVANQTDVARNRPETVVWPMNGYCKGSFATETFWRMRCIDLTPNDPRYCIDASSDTCPPDSFPDSSGQAYSPEDYARDMTDEAALLIRSTNSHEPAGNDIAIYSIGLGNWVGRYSLWPGSGEAYGEGLLRYMAAVGDDGDRVTDPCAGKSEKTNCGQYYYAATGDALLPIFENIASRIYTRIAE
jgi:hypothetical protein